jgi:EmrB/QacA subfamily drug resistance transporter
MLFTVGLAAMDATIVATAVPSIAKDLGGFSLFPWLFSAYLLAMSVATPIYGKLADVYGRKPLLVTGVVVFLTGSALAGVSWSMGSLIVFRALQGIGAGGVQPLVMTLAGDLYSVRERAKVQGWIAGVWALAAVVGPLTGGLFAEYVSWRWIFFVNLPIGAAALFVITSNLHEPALPRRRHRIDFAGAALLVVGAGMLVFALLEGGVQWSWTSPQSVLSFAVAAAALVLFSWQERRAAEPILPTWLFTRRLLLVGALSSLMLGAMMICTMTYIPTFGQGVLGLGPVAAGFVLASMIIGWSGTATLAGRLYLRIGFRNTAILGTALSVLAGVLLSLLFRQPVVWLVVVGCVVIGCGLGFQSISVLVGTQSVVDWGRRGVVTGSIMFMRTIGQAIGAGIFGAVANATLATWFSSAPASVAHRLPSVNAATEVLGGNRLHGPVADYITRGIELATHRVFLALLAFAVVAVLVVLALPRRFTTPRFEEDEAELEPRAEPVRAG